jgi:hypothetical protein
MDYRSERPFADLAEGLIEATLEHFDEDLSIVREPGPTGDACSARFIIG